MPAVLRVIALRLIAGVGVIVAVLASISGVVDAVDWGCKTFGSMAVFIVGAFAAGAVVMHAVDRGLAEARRRGRSRGRGRSAPTG